MCHYTSSITNIWPRTLFISLLLHYCIVSCFTGHKSQQYQVITNDDGTVIEVRGFGDTLDTLCKYMYNSIVLFISWLTVYISGGVSEKASLNRLMYLMVWLLLYLDCGKMTEAMLQPYACGNN